MTDLETRLRDALGDAYRIERELGGGGMSRVFLAHETALGRQVVVKVLPPEMAAGVNIERFRREIQLAASLQHPHIVPLHAAGQSGDLFYYTMPLVEGESLRGRLAREGELPIPDVVRILRDVVDALAYAHDHRVVHRDIKPDNILLSGGHAVVTDFGVAKAVSAASGESSLTSLGVALGTPAYMAPEQAAADPHVDHRADIYAVGALAYEMLCGRPPFAATTPQAMLAAHVTQAPDPVTNHRPTVPPALSALIMRCLEKKPADRPQRADEVRAQLEAIATPTGGMTPTTTEPISTGTLAAYRRAHPLRVAALFAGAAAFVLTFVWLVIRQVGLPRWVFPAAVGLLAVGLPIVLLTGRFERRRALARTTGTAVPGKGVTGLFTWRRAIAGGGVGFAALGAVTAAYMGMRALGIGPVGTLVGSGALEQQARVLLAEFVNHTSDAALGHTLTDAFRVDFAQSRVVRLAEAGVVSAALERMGQPVTTLLSPDLARELAQRAGIPAIILGQIDPVGSAYVLSASVVSAADGRTLTAVRANAGTDAELIDALDQLSKDLRERIGESFRSLNRAQPLARVTTASLGALRKFTRAEELADANDYEGAAALLREAIALDTGFAMAYRKLAVVLGNAGASYVDVADATRRAYVGRDRLPELERYLATAYYHEQLDWDADAIVAAYRSALALDPESDVALNNLGLMLMRRRQWTGAESLYVRGLDLGYGGVYWGNAIQALLVQDKPAEAQSLLERFAQAAPGNPDVIRLRMLLASQQRDHAAAERDAQELLLTHRASPRWRQIASSDVARTKAALGKVADARRYGREAIDVAAQRGLPGDYVGGAVQLGRIDLVYRGSPAAALDTVRAALRRFPLESIPALDRPYTALIQLYADAGDAREARRLLTEYERAVPEGIRRGEWTRHLAIGAVAEAEGRAPHAVASYRAARDENGFCEFCGYARMARVFANTGDADSALVYYERAVNTPSPYRVFSDAFETAAAYQRLGELYEARGDRDRAIDSYGRLTDLWKTADAELQPIVRDVQARIARLSAER